MTMKSLQRIGKAESQDISRCKILIVEDDFIGRATLVQIFRKNGFSNIEEAENGRVGWEKIKQDKPDIIVSDIQMPQMDGFELCRCVRSHGDPFISGIPILVQTSLSESKEKAQVFKVGASDYISKPVDPQEIIARVRVHLEREMMTRNLREFNSRVLQELETAKSTQSVLVPDKSIIAEIERAYDLHIEGHLSPCSELGGDFWSMKPISTHELAIFTVDFAGHGVNAALNVFRLHALIHGAHGVANTPSAYLTHLNAVLSPLLPTGQYATMFYGVIDTKENQLSYASAASPAPVMFRRDGTYEILDSSGVLFGAFNSTAYDIRIVPFRAGDCLLLYSDALIETPDVEGDTLKIEDAAEIFRAKIPADASGRTAFKALLGHFNQQYASALSDDLTLVSIAI